MPSARPRLTLVSGLALMALSLAGLVVSIPAMADRLSHRPELRDRPLAWFEDPVTIDRFTFRGEPVAIETRERDESGAALDPPIVVVTWRGQEAHFPVGGRDDPRLPGLLRHEDWFKIMTMAQAKAPSSDEVRRMIAEGRTRPRLIAAARYPAEGYDPGSWGLVRRREWRYRFVEFLADGPAESSIRSWETTYADLERAVAPGPYDKPVELSRADEAEKLWQHGAMLQVTPAMLYRARDKQVQQGIHAMGWTWPVGGASMLGLAAGAALVAASRVGRG